MNRYVHGTYITSAHSHLALFGVFGFLALAVCFYILFNEHAVSQKSYRWCLLAILFLNIGLLTMGLGLLAAGGLQVYFARVIGLGIGETNQLIRPYLFIRMMGGFAYTVGSTVLTYTVVKSLWPNLRPIFLNEGKTCSVNSDEWQQLHSLLTRLIQKEKEAEQLLLKINCLLFRNKTKQ